MHSTIYQEEMIVLSFIEKNRMVTKKKKKKNFVYARGNENGHLYN